MSRRQDFRVDFERLIGLFRSDQAVLQSRDDAANEADVRESYVFELLGLLGYPTRSPVSFRRERGLSRRTPGPSSADRPDAVVLDRRSRPLLAVDTKRYQAVDSNLVLTQKQRKDLAATKYLSRRQMELEKLRYCVGPDRPRFLLYTDFERLYVFDGNLPQANEHPVLAYDALDEQLAASDDLFDALSYRAVCGGSLLRLADRITLQPLDEIFLERLNDWRGRLAELLYRSNPHHPDLRTPDGAFDFARLQSAVQRLLDRIILIQIIDHKGLLPEDERLYGLIGDALAHYDRMVPTSLRQGLQARFQRFNDLYNSTIFEPHLIDRLDYPQEKMAEVLGEVVSFYYKPFSAELLGTIYERYAGFRLEMGADGGIGRREDMRFRRSSGTYYTPRHIVDYIVEATVSKCLEGKTVEDVQGLRVLDPACGSGTFLLGAFDRLADFYRGEQGRILRGLDRARDPDRRAALVRSQALAFNYPRRILERHLYGVDLNPEAAEFATVSLIVRALEYARQHDVAGDLHLPLILNQNVKVGNSLISGAQGPEDLTPHRGRLAKLYALRGRLRAVSEAGEGRPRNGEKADLIQQVEALTEEVNASLNASLEAHFPGGVAEKRPFNYEVEFPEVFLDPDGALRAGGGFGCVIGNPPYDVLSARRSDFLHADADRTERARQAEEYEQARSAFQEDAQYYRRSGRFTHSAVGVIDLYRLMTEQAFRVLANGGRFGFIAPRSLMADLNAADLRKHILTRSRVEIIEAFPKDPPGAWVFPEAELATCIPIAEAGGPTEQVRVRAHTDRYVAEDSPVTTVRADQITRIDPERWAIPVVDEKGLKLLLKLHGSPRYGRVEQIAESYRGEADSDLHKRYMKDRDTGTLLLRGRHIHRYHTDLSAEKREKRWLDREGYLKDMGTAPKAQHHLQPRAVKQGVNDMNDPRRLIFSACPAGVFVSDSADYFLVRPPYEVMYFIALMNSRVPEWRFRLTSTNNNVNTYEVRSIPVPTISFTTPAEARARLGERGRSLCDACLRSGDPTPLLDFVQERFSADPEQSDAVHDLLVHLAERMTALCEERRGVVTDFARYVEGFPISLPLRRVVEALPVARLRSLSREGNRTDVDLRAVRTRREGEEVVVSATLRGPEGDAEVDLYALALEEPTASLVALYLPIAELPSVSAVRRLYKLGPRERLTVWQRVTSVLLPRAQPEALMPRLEEYRASVARAGEIDRRISLTDTLIDRIVYRLYDLAEREIKVVEGKGGM